MLLVGLLRYKLYHLCWRSAMDEDDSSAYLMILEWLDRHRESTKLLRDSANFKLRGMTPLHCVLQQQRPPFYLVKRLVEIAPQTLLMKDWCGDLPLHYGCLYGAGSSLEIMSMLVTTCTNSIHVKDNNGVTPLRYLLDSRISKRKDDNGMTLLHHLCHDGAPFEVLALFIAASPESIAEADNQGMLPIHHACLSTNRSSIFNVFQNLSDAYPESVCIEDHNGRNPSALLKIFSKRMSSNGMLLLHHFCRYTVSTNIFKLVFHAYPESLTYKDKNNMLPLHHACINEATTIDLIMMCIQLCPESILM
mmetsp:Transcript_4226/g.6246  ORF Transcript_4226/g.6246 Transcript_4226/m.6246 type:complete len:306 (+) Transcript_4226:128-1045(+)